MTSLTSSSPMSHLIQMKPFRFEVETLFQSVPGKFRQCNNFMIILGLNLASQGPIPPLFPPTNDIISSGDLSVRGLHAVELGVGRGTGPRGSGRCCAVPGHWVSVLALHSRVPPAGQRVSVCLNSQLAGRGPLSVSPGVRAASGGSVHFCPDLPATAPAVSVCRPCHFPAAPGGQKAFSPSAA